MHSYNAGGYNGWTTAHKIFEELGFEKKQIRRGHRVFESYSYKEKEEEIPQFKGTHKELDKIISSYNTLKNNFISGIDEANFLKLSKREKSYFLSFLKEDGETEKYTKFINLLSK